MIHVRERTKNSSEDTDNGEEQTTSPDLGVTSSPPIIERDSLCFGNPDGYQCNKTGRIGEIVAYRYFSEKLGLGPAVKWVNEESETGLPYDLIIERESTEYVEVKSTTSASKDWFPISTNEFRYAIEKEDAFSIVRVVLLGPTDAEISVLKNPVKLCQRNVLQLALLVPHGSSELPSACHSSGIVQNSQN